MGNGHDQFQTSYQSLVFQSFFFSLQNCFLWMLHFVYWHHQLFSFSHKHLQYEQLLNLVFRKDFAVFLLCDQQTRHYSPFRCMDEHSFETQLPSLLKRCSIWVHLREVPCRKLSWPLFSSPYCEDREPWKDLHKNMFPSIWH